MRLFLPSFLCIVLLFIHAYKYRGRNIALSFFIWCYLIKAFKALCDSNPESRDYFPLMDFLGLTYNGVPYGSYLFVIPTGWIFAHYISWCIAEEVLRSNPNKKNAFFPTIALATLGTGLVGVCMETVNIGLEWWRWEAHINQSTVQYFAVWTIWSVMFYYFYFLMYIEGPNPKWLKFAAFIYVFMFFISLAFYIQFQIVMAIFYWGLLFLQVPLFFVNRVKLRPMLKKDMVDT